jgi:uncharacterized membrane protein YqgA involved in biofilm formation
VSVRGTIVNVVAVLVGSGIGLAVGDRLSERLQRIIQEGMSGNPDIIYTKSMLDGAASVAFASSLGVGVSCAAITVLILQGALTLLGRQLAFLLRPEILNELTATGGLLILAIGLLLLDVKRLRVANLLPALAVAVLLTAVRLSLGW